MTTERLQALLQISSEDERICPQPGLWLRFWELIGSPRAEAGPPLVLSGWMSSDRAKQKRFQEHLAYAASHGMFEDAERFISGLASHEWHRCSPRGLDWSYGQEVEKGLRERAAAVNNARQIYRRLRAMSDSEAYDSSNLGEMLCLFHLMFQSSADFEPVRRHIKEILASYENSTAECELPLHHDAPDSVRKEIETLAYTMNVQWQLLQLLQCVASDPQEYSAIGRAEIDEFLGEVFEA